MTARKKAGLIGVWCAVLVAVLPFAVSAQEAEPASPQAPPGPLVLERVESGLVFGPDVKVTDIDGETGTLVGGYVGWIHHERLLVGGAGYWLVNGPGDLDMAYGGLLVGWNVTISDRIRFGVRGLVGGGQASEPGAVLLSGRPVPYHDTAFGHGFPPASRPGTIHMRWSETFVLFEPQGIVTVRLLDRVGLDLGVGYRVVGSAEFLDDRLRGLTGSIAIRFGH